MNRAEAKISTRVRTTKAWSGIPLWSEGVIDEHYTIGQGWGCMVAWDLPGRPLPKGYSEHDGTPVARSGILRDGFSEDELRYLEVV